MWSQCSIILVQDCKLTSKPRLINKWVSSGRSSLISLHHIQLLIAEVRVQLPAAMAGFFCRSQVIVLPIQEVSQTLVKANLYNRPN